MICCARSGTVLYDLPSARTGKRGRPRTHGERLELSAIQLEKPEKAPYYMGCRRVITNLWKKRTVYAYMTTADPDRSESFRLFLCTAIPEEITVRPEEQSDEKIRSYHAWGMLPYYNSEFKDHQGQSAQEIRYQLGEKIRMNIIIHSLGRTIETIKKDLPLKKAFQELMRKCGYL